MSLLFETIRVEDGIPRHLQYHNARLNGSRRALLGAAEPIDLARAVAVPADLGTGTFRCRVLYDRRIDEISFTPYVRKSVASLTLADAAGLDYGHKYTDRSAIDRLLASAETDDILMIIDGLVTDTSFANVAFYDGSRWITPSRPLLPGTARARLLDEGKIVAGEIPVGGLRKFRAATIFNAMIDFDPSIRIRMEDIRA